MTTVMAFVVVAQYCPALFQLVDVLGGQVTTELDPKWGMAPAPVDINRKKGPAVGLAP
jgi:hypothetical protein